MQFSATIALGMLPLLVFGGAALLRPAPDVVPKPVQSEGVRVIAMDTRTFSARWLPLYAVAPATVIHEVPVERTLTVAPPVRSTSLRAAPPARIVRRASLRLDVCAKHGLRRVEYLKRGYKHWRCRR